MKTTLATLSVLLLAPLGAALHGCTETGDKCSVSYPPRYFDVQGVSLDAMQAAPSRAIVSGEEAVATAILLELRLQSRFYGQAPAPSNWLPAAAACPPTPTPGYGGTTEVLDSLTLRCVQAYDAAHPAGALVNDLLFVENRGPLPAAPLAPSQPANLTLRLLQPPAQPGPQQFELRYRLTNGEVYTARTVVLTLR